MPPPLSRPSPSCSQVMQLQELPGQYSSGVEIDFCFGGQLQVLHALEPHALVAMARERSRYQAPDSWSPHSRPTGTGLAVDLFAVGLSLVSSLWDD